MITATVRLTGYNFRVSNAAIEVDRTGDAAYAEGQIESFDHPGDYPELAEGKGMVDLRTLPERGQYMRTGRSETALFLGAGMPLALTGDHMNEVKVADYSCRVVGIPIWSVQTNALICIKRLICGVARPDCTILLKGRDMTTTLKGENTGPVGANISEMVGELMKLNSAMST